MTLAVFRQLPELNLDLKPGNPIEGLWGFVRYRMSSSSTCSRWLVIEEGGKLWRTPWWDNVGISPRPSQLFIAV